MKSLQIAVLGKPQLSYNNQPLTADLISAKGQALLIYLAVTNQNHSRTALACLLWGDMPEETARANLRLTLSKLRKFLPETILFTSRLEIGLVDFWLDVNEFEKGLETGGWRLFQSPISSLQSPLNLYRGDFLDEFYLPNVPEFDTWVLGQPTYRLITLLGEGGVGKTRLALAAAEQMKEQFTDRVWFVSLRLYLTCYEVQQQVGDEGAEGVLTNGRLFLQTHADQIHDSVLQRGFLENIPSHRTILNL